MKIERFLRHDLEIKKRMKRLFVSGVFLFVALFLSITLSGCAANRKIEYLNSHPDLPEAIRQAILGRNLIKGMNKEHVLLSLGKPGKKEAYENYFGIREIWVYGDCMNSKCSILYFDSDGQLVYFSRYRFE